MIKQPPITISGKIWWIVRTIIFAPVWFMYRFGNNGKRYDQTVTFEVMRYRLLKHKCAYNKNKPVIEKNGWIHYKCEYFGCNIIHPTFPKGAEIKEGDEYDIIDNPLEECKPIYES